MVPNAAIRNLIREDKVHQIYSQMQVGQAPAHGMQTMNQPFSRLEALLGRIAAGAPILAQENVESTIRIDRDMVRGGREVFALRVQGDSMIEAGILSGDTIFVRRQPTANRGEIVCALIGDEATVKYYFPEKDYIRFQPANSAMAPILVRAVDFKPTMLLGIVVSVFRQL
jgi:repressor LexA